MVMYTNTRGIPEQMGHLSLNINVHSGKEKTETRDLNKDDEQIGSGGWIAHYIDLPAEVFHVSIVYLSIIYLNITGLNFFLWHILFSIFGKIYLKIFIIFNFVTVNQSLFH